eukprot:761747-Hanusia_phi.AAC.7
MSAAGLTMEVAGRAATASKMREELKYMMSMRTGRTVDVSLSWCEEDSLVPPSSRMHFLLKSEGSATDLTKGLAKEEMNKSLMKHGLYLDDVKVEILNARGEDKYINDEDLRDNFQTCLSASEELSNKLQSSCISSSHR